MNDEQLVEVLVKNAKMECKCEYGPLDDSGNPHLPWCVKDSLQRDVRWLVHEVRLLRAKNRVIEAERDMALIVAQVEKVRI